MKPIVLIGYRGSGKTAAGKGLARKMGLPFYDSDQWIVRLLGRTIGEFVEASGWEAFRALEKTTVQEIFRQKPGVVSLGGGAVLDPENRALIREKGMVVWLKAEVPTLLKRMESDPTSKNNRPALSDWDWEKETKTILAERTPIYEETAHTVLDTEGKSLEEVVEELHALAKNVKRIS
jgi:shikimate kinase